MSYPVQVIPGHASVTATECSNVIAVLKNYHGRVMSLFSPLNAEGKWADIAMRILTFISIPVIYPILGAVALLNYVTLLLNRSLINLKCYSVFNQLLGLNGYQVNLELRPESTDQWDSIKVLMSIGDIIYSGHPKRMLTLSSVIPSDGTNHHPQWFRDQIKQHKSVFNRQINTYYFPLKMGLPEVTIELFVKRLDGSFTGVYQTSSGSGGPGFLENFNPIEAEEHFKRRFSYIGLPYSPQLNSSLNFQ